jgi:sigma-B regulation protein RsbU (phosphoserine phosphatase)
MFATACYAVLDPAQRQLHLAIAGHPGPYLCRHAGALVERLTPRRGPALGLFEMAEFPEATVPVAADDLLLLYTDGISEVEGPGGEFFETRLPEALCRHAGEDPEVFLDDLIDDARRFSATGGFHDDVCLIALQVGQTAGRSLIQSIAR